MSLFVTSRVSLIIYFSPVFIRPVIPCFCVRSCLSYSCAPCFPVCNTIDIVFDNSSPPRSQLPSDCEVVVVVVVVGGGVGV